MARPQVQRAAGGEDAASSPVSALARFAVNVLAVDSLEDLLGATVQAAVTALSADSVHIGEVDRPRGRLRILRNAGALADWELETPTDESYLIAEHPQLLESTEQARPWRGNVDDDLIAEIDRRLLASQGKAHALSVPVVSPSGVWGELYVTRFASQPFSDVDEEAALVIAGVAAGGLARVLGDEHLRELAYTDALTGLANRRSADDQLEAWASDPACAEMLTVVLCDVNGLKRVNDTYGHLVGDRVIREVAGFVSAAAGQLPSGLAARVGGDEFLIASLCRDQTLVTTLVDDLAMATRRLTFGEGVSCGIASAGALLQPEASPQSLVRSLLRIADSEQYRDKFAARDDDDAMSPGEVAGQHAGRAGSRVYRDTDAGVTVATNPAVTMVAGSRQHHQAGELLAWVCAIPADTPVEERLAQMARAVCELAGAVAWWVSEVDAAHGTIRGVSCGTVRETGVSDGLWPMVELDPDVFMLADFPATARVVRERGVFYADTFDGDAAERHLLIQTGFQSVIAAGDVDSAGRSWLVEVYGDSLTEGLHELTTLLRDATDRSCRGESLRDQWSMPNLLE